MFKALIIFGGGFFVSLIFYHLRRYLKKHERIIDWDISKLLIVTLDIEVECENGFPSPEIAQEPMLSITIKNHVRCVLYVMPTLMGFQLTI